MGRLSQVTRIWELDCIKFKKNQDSHVLQTFQPLVAPSFVEMDSRVLRRAAYQPEDTVPEPVVGVREHQIHTPKIHLSWASIRDSKRDTRLATPPSKEPKSRGHERGPTDNQPIYISRLFNRINVRSSRDYGRHDINITTVRVKIWAIIPKHTSTPKACV